MTNFGFVSLVILVAIPGIIGRDNLQLYGWSGSVGFFSLIATIIILYLLSRRIVPEWRGPRLIFTRRSSGFWWWIQLGMMVIILSFLPGPIPQDIYDHKFISNMCKVNDTNQTITALDLTFNYMFRRMQSYTVAFGLLCFYFGALCEAIRDRISRPVT